MAEVLFFMTESDTAEFASFLIREYECRFTMDGADQPELPELGSPDDVASRLDPDGFPARFFVTSPRWSGFPLYTHEINHNDGRHRWYVQQRYGGPAFDFKVSKACNQQGEKLVPGWFMDYPWYYIRPGDTTTIDRPPEMAKTFNAVKRFLRRNGVESWHRWSKHWIMPDAVRQFEEGRLRPPD